MACELHRGQAYGLRSNVTIHFFAIALVNYTQIKVNEVCPPYYLIYATASAF